jgi:hypothetical protein
VVVVEEDRRAAANSSPPGGVTVPRISGEMMRASCVAVGLVCALLAAGCGSGDDKEPTATAPGVPATCDPESFLPPLQDTLDNPAEKLRIVRADVRRCRNGYAQVFAVPDQSVCEPGVGYCYQDEQVFFGRVNGEWRILASGTGIGCSEADLPPEMRDACRALGYG